MQEDRMKPLERSTHLIRRRPKKELHEAGRRPHRSSRWLKAKGLRESIGSLLQNQEDTIRKPKNHTVIPSWNEYNVQVGSRLKSLFQVPQAL